MAALAMTTTPLVARVNKVSTRSTRRNLVVRAEKVAHGKGGEEGGRSFNNDAFGMVAKNANYTLFASAISKCGLEECLTSPGPFTVFCPNNDAFEELARKLGVSKMDLLANDRIPQIVRSHIVQGPNRLANMSDGTQLTTIAGNTLTISNGAVNGIQIKKADIKVDNAIMMAIGEVIVI